MKNFIILFLLFLAALPASFAQCKDAYEDCSYHKRKLQQKPRLIGNKKTFEKLLLSHKKELLPFVGANNPYCLFFLVDKTGKPHLNKERKEKVKLTAQCLSNSCYAAVPLGALKPRSGDISVAVDRVGAF